MTPKLLGHAFGVYECVIATEHENAIRHSPYLVHNSNIACAIAIAKIDRLQLESCSQGPARDANCDPRSKNSKNGHRIGTSPSPEYASYDVESKNLLTN